ncbi:hypothetical protein [Ideonella dechloratans]|uniref:hypothetical protein n=1 Tax=Ideonella dechloratans TaxID=36863 RepID=UPI0035B25C30
MGRPSVIPAVRERLEQYLDQREAEFLAQPLDQRHSTLPSTADGKVNVRAVAKAIELKETQEKYLYEREELSSLINLVAEGQGLLPIGARLLQDAGDKALKERLVRQAQAARGAAQAAVEAQAVHDELLEKVRELAADNESLRAENLRLRAQLDAMSDGLYVRVSD